MAKPKHSAEWKIAIVKKYLSEEGGYATLAEVYRIGKRTLRDWVRRYREQGGAGFSHGSDNKHYSKEFKVKCVEAVLLGERSVDDIVAKYNISSGSILRSWIVKYNANMERKNYEPKREVYMAEVRRKTTLEVRKEIVDYCISRNYGYMGAASKYDVS